MKLKRGDLPLELIRMVLKREIEKKKRKGSNCSYFDDEQEEEENKCDMMRELPNGLMAISSSSPHFDNEGSCSASGSGSGSGSGSVSGSCFNAKVGKTETNNVAITRRRFRSKNIDPLSVDAMQAVPWKKNVLNLRRRRTIRYFVKLEDVKIACPVCRGTCGCKPCSVSFHGDTKCKVC
ncbi:hypothetical protein PTKIN_Ptkin01aG0128300 [Pterospermum kingtungense]